MPFFKSFLVSLLPSQHFWQVFMVKILLSNNGLPLDNTDGSILILILILFNEPIIPLMKSAEK